MGSQLSALSAVLSDGEGYGENESCCLFPHCELTKHIKQNFKKSTSSSSLLSALSSSLPLIHAFTFRTLFVYFPIYLFCTLTHSYMCLQSARFANSFGRSFKRCILSHFRQKLKCKFRFLKGSWIFFDN